MDHVRRTIASCGLLVTMLVACLPAVDLPDTPFDESDTSVVNVAIPETPRRNQAEPVSRSIEVPVRNWTQPGIRPERVVHAAQHPSARVALALFCTLIC